MQDIKLLFDTTSRNAFEEFFRLIEQGRLFFQDEGIIKSLDFLEKVLMLIERDLQDISISKFPDIYFSKLINEINMFLLRLFRFLDVNQGTLDYPPLHPYNAIDAISYHIMIAITLLNNINVDNFYNILKYLYKISFSVKTIRLLDDFDDYFDYTIHSDDEVNRHRSKSDVILSFQKGISTNSFKSSLFDFKSSSPNEENFSKILRLLWESVDNNFVSRFRQNYFDLYMFGAYKSISILQLNNQLKIDLQNKIESLFRLNDNDCRFEWYVNIVFFNIDNLYSAKNVSYLIHSFSSALESIDNIQVILDDWGSGSKWVQLKINIKDDLAKIDLKDILNKSRQQLEAVLNRKTLGEVQKYEAEAKKIDAEAELIRREIETMPDPYDASIKYELDLLAQKIELENKYLDLELKREDIKSKKIDNVLKASELINNGIIANDGKIQMFINDCLFNSIDNSTFDLNGLKSIDEIEAKEVIVKKTIKT